nr:alpha/beta fold hydrolase [Allomuricauda sp.]
MKHIIISVFFISTILSCNTTPNPLEDAQQRYPMLRPCKVEGIHEEILCGTIEVHEDQINKSGKKIPLNVYLFPSFEPNPGNSVFVDYAGGPGVPNSLFIPYYEKDGFSSPFRELRDVLIVDKRGTGASAITCKAMESIPIPLDYYLYDTALIADCLKEVQGKVDLTHYNTSAQVEDLEDIRKWLGVETYDFHGISYGARVGLELVRRYPNSVSSAMFTGMVPPDFGLFEFVDYEIERVLEKLLSRCEADPLCHSNFPDFENQIYGLRKDLKKSPIDYPYVHRESNRTHTIKFNDMAFLGMVANLFYHGTRIERLPGIIKEAHSGNFSPLIESNLSSMQLAIPLHLSQFCPEESNRHPVSNFEALDTLFTRGMGALTEFRACQVWQKIPTPQWPDQPIGGKTPMLLFSGEDDVLTPPRMNESVGEFFPNSIHIVFKNQGHTYTDWSCWDNLVYQFLENRGAINELDTTCVGKIKRPKFVMEQSDNQ